MTIRRPSKEDLVDIGDRYHLNLTEAERSFRPRSYPRCAGRESAIAPVLEELAADYGERLTVAKVNVDENNSKAAERYLAALEAKAPSQRSSSSATGSPSNPWLASRAH